MSQVVQDFNRLYTHKFATAKAIPKAQRKLLALVGKEKTLLDVGCGSGFYTSQFRDAGNRVTGIDLTLEGAQATNQLDIPTSITNLEQGLPFPDCAFETVTFIEVIEHLLRPDLAIQEIHRVLKVEGALVLTTPNYAYWVLRLLYAFGQPPVGLHPRPFTGLRSRQAAEEIEPWLDPHIRFFTPQIIRRLLTQFNFEIISIQSTFVAFPSGLAPFLPWLPGLPLRVIGKLLGNLEALGDYWPSMLAGGLMVKAIKK